MSSVLPTLGRVLLVALAAQTIRAAELGHHMMLRSAPDCQTAFANPPTPVTSFLTTDAQALLWFTVSGAKTGDVATSQYYAPNGLEYGVSGGWEAVPHDGNFCFPDVPMQIAGAPPASYPGVWTVRVTYNGATLFTLNFTIVSAGGTGSPMVVNAKANIYASGRATAFDGELPPFYRFSAGAGKVFTVTSATGSVTTSPASGSHGPDGRASPTNVNPYKGISGIKHDTKAMFMVGVFLDDSEPADPPPATMDFTNDSFASLSPLLRQVFFIGDGLTGTGNGARQQFNVPAGATRLFLGFADAYNYIGNPGYYSDNAGSLTVAFEIGGGGGSGSNLLVNGSFEQPGGGRRWSLGRNSTYITGWLVTRDNVDYTTADFVPSDGSYIVDLDGTGMAQNAGAIAQTVSTTPGTAYTVTFDMAGNTDCGPTIKQMRVAAAGQQADFSFDATGRSHSNPGWSTRTFSFLAQSTSTTLEFSSLDPATGQCGPLLDNVRLAAGGGGGAICTYTISPASASIIASGGSGSIGVSAGGGCPWTATSGVSWMTVTGGASGSGNGTVSFAVAANTGSAARTGTITIAGQVFTVTQSGATASGVTGLVVDSKANIFAAGRASAFDGILPPFVRIVPGAGQVVTITSVTGQVACTGSDRNGPDGTTTCAGGKTDINSYQGISGIIHHGRGMFLVGVFLDDQTPKDPAPPRLDFTNNDNFTSISPLIGQVFFIGDGLTATGVRQEFRAPSAATRLFLGIADALEFHGNPGWYGDNSGSFTVNLQGGVAGATCTYSISPTSASIAASGGSGSISVSAGGGCPWTATSGVSWITVTGGASGSGNGAVSYTVAANTGSAARTGTMTVAGQAFTLTQGAPAGSDCNYFVNPLTQSIPGSGGSALVLVTTAARCSWTATSNVSWITIRAGSSGTGSGAVEYVVAANTGSGARTGTLTIAGQTHTVTQAGGIVCTYAIAPANRNVPAGGASGGVVVTTDAGCAWTATSGVSWITITSPASGQGTATVRYSVAANTGASPRTGTLSIAGQAFTVNQEAAAQTGGPAIDTGGVVNAASYTPSDLASGALARGSMITIFGNGLGPAQFAQATEYPIPTALGGVSVKLTQGNTSMNAYLVFASPTQINAILPSKAPLGSVEIQVSFQGSTSLSVPVKIVDYSFGAFSTASGRGPGIIQNYVSPTDVPLNTLSNPATPGQIAILWGTGLGPISAADYLPPAAGDLPVSVEVLVGGKPARRIYSGRAPGFAGVDNVYFEVPADAPQGCYVPVQVKVADSGYGNPVTMAIGKAGQRCSTVNPFSDILTFGGKTGVVSLLRIGIYAAIVPGAPALEATVDAGLGVFVESQPTGELGFNPLLSFPPPGACTAYAQSLDLSGLLGGGTSLTSKPLRELDAGASLAVSGPKGKATLEHLNTDEKTGPYAALIGGGVPGFGPTPTPLFIEGGSYTIAGPGGKDVGPFSVTFTLPPPLNWTNRNELATVDRNSNLTVKWSGTTASQLVLIAGLSTNQKTKASGAFVCVANGSEQSFTVPASMLANLPAAAGTDTISLLLVGAAPGSERPTFTATGLDRGMVLGASFQASLVTFK